VGRKRLLDSTFFVSKRAGRAAHEHDMLPDGSTALVALSGGPASLALLRVMHERQGRVPTQVSFIPAHVPDGVFGPGHDVAGMLRTECGRLGLDLVVAHREAPPHSWEDMVPHRDQLLELARRHHAGVVMLGHTILDRALVVLSSLVREGRVRQLLPVEELGAGCEDHAPGVKVVRPLSHVTHQAVARMVAEEGLPHLERTLRGPGEELRRELVAFVESRKGSLMEKLRNVTNAPDNIIDEYLV